MSTSKSLSRFIGQPSNLHMLIFIIILSLLVLFFNFIDYKFSNAELKRDISHYNGILNDIIHPLMSNYETDSVDRYYSNQYFMPNNNLYPYSVYIIPNNTINSYGTINEQYFIESIVDYNHKYLKRNSFANLSDFKCLIKLINLKNYHSKEEILELNPIWSPHWITNYGRKLRFIIKPSDFKSVIVDKINFNIKNIVVGVFRTLDYNKSLDDLATFESYMSNIELKLPLQLPYGMINYQVPTIIYPVEPRIKAACAVIQYTFEIKPYFKEWIDLYLNWGTPEFLVYDGTHNHDFKTFIEKHYSHVIDKFKIIHFFNNDTDFCNEKRIVDECIHGSPNLKCPDKLKSYLLGLCAWFYDNSGWKDKHAHDQLTSNDAYTILSRKYEFIIDYDVDEIVFPRQIDIKKTMELNKTFSCDNRREICEEKQFLFTDPSESTSNGAYFYNYLQYLMKNYNNGGDINKINSIVFDHALYIPVDALENKLIDDIKLAIEKIDNYYYQIEIAKSNNQLLPTTVFPIEIYYTHPNVNSGHIFVIQEEDINHLKYIYNGYKTFLPCIYDKYVKNITEIDQVFLRPLYYLTEGYERTVKSVYYYKNTNSMFVHYATDYEPDSYMLWPDALNGHFISHFRHNVYQVHKNASGSIKKLNIDFELMHYLLKNHTSYCSN